MDRKEAEEHIKKAEAPIYWWKCPVCLLEDDEEQRYFTDAVENLIWHMEDEHDD